MELGFRVITDAPAGDLEAVFAGYWPAYSDWINRAPIRDTELCRLTLGQHMPELIPVHDLLLARFGGSDEISRFLTLYRPPPVMRACTQLVLDDDAGPVLLRSYDHHPRFFDGVILSSRWAQTPTLAVTDCIWGALDGINSHGLAIALAFGGRKVVGDGFAAPLICRYVLETCATVAEARAALFRLPVYMPYTFVVVDASGDFVTAFLGPDASPVFVTRRTSANHQGSIEWPAYARFVESAERLERVEALVEPTSSIEDARSAFLSAPLWRTNYAKASGTLYVAEYATLTRTLALHWPGRTETIALDDAADRSFSVDLPQAAVM